MRKLASTACLVATMALLIGVAPLWFGLQSVNAADITNRFLRLESASPNATTTHTFGFDYVSATNVGSVKFEYCANTPIIGLPCVEPAGLDVSSASLDLQTNETGFVIDPGLTDNNEIVLTRIPEPVTPGASTYQFSNVVNPSSANTTFYARITTYASTDTTGPLTDGGGVAVSTVEDVTVSAFVPPFLEFCVGIVIFANDCSTASGNLINMGAFSETSATTAISKFQAATNAPGGYNVIVTGQTFTSGNNVIPASNNPSPSQVGNSQFGMNLRANSNPAVGLEPAGPGTATPAPRYNQVDNFVFSTGDQLVNSTLPNDRVTFTASYIVNINANQKKGNYSTTLTYICTGAF